MNEQNLKPFTKEQSHDEAVKNGRKGGLQLGENNRKRKAFKEHIENELDKEFEFDGYIVTVKELATIKLIKRLIADDIKDADFLKLLEFVVAQIGEKPVEKYQFQNEISQETIEEVERLVAEAFESE